jgi:hypothetical protein
MDIVCKKGVVNHADAMSRRLDVKDSLKKLQLLRDWTNDDAKCELHAQLFPWNPGYILTLDFMRKSKTFMTWIYTCLPGISAYLDGTLVEWSFVRLRDKIVCSERLYIAIKSTVRTTRRTDRGTSWYY